MTILILSAACCYPGLAAFDEQAKQTALDAAREAGLEAQVKIIPGATAVYSGVVPKKTVNMLMEKFSRNETGPAIMIDGEAVHFGVPTPAEMKAVLEKYRVNQSK